jgi:hypothetical protein
MQRSGVEVVELAATIPRGRDQTSRLEDVEVLRDSLPRGTHTVLRRETCAKLEQGLPVQVGEFVKDGAAGGVGDHVEHVSHN